jgi:3-dehydroquinate dehydratase II
MPKLLVLQGANMNWLGQREPELYGRTTAAELDAKLREYAQKGGFSIDIVYTNHEGEAIECLYRAVADRVDAVVLNPGGFSYAGYALRDCIKGITVPVVELHMTNHYARDIHSVTASASRGVLMGFGVNTYFRAVDAALDIVAGAAIRSSEQ